MSDNEYPDEYLDENGNEYQEEKPEQERGELRPCPFCGTLPQANAWIFRGISETRYFCPNQECPLSVRTVTLEEWNTRPIEDALEARIAELEEKQRWRPVSERMPDNWESVLTFDISKSTRGAVTAFYNPETSLWSTPFSSDLWVTHWMPLPEPPIVYGKVCEE